MTIRSRNARSILALSAILAASQALAQTSCTSAGADVIVGDILGPANYNLSGDIDAFSVGVTFCNIGSAPVPFNANNNHHPVVAQGLYRLSVVDGAARFEQIGQSWCFHTFFALSTGLCCSDCQPTDGRTLGVHCSSPETASRMGSQAALGPKHQVNAASGVFTFPAANPPFAGPIDRRLQARIVDVHPAQNPGAVYYVEGVSVSPEDAAAGGGANNASYRRCLFSPGNDLSGVSMSLTGATTRGAAAIQAWAASDPLVSLVSVSVPGDGRFLVAGRATQIATATWRYEYAVENLSSDRSAGAFSVPSITDDHAFARNIGFHDVDYHSGDGLNNINFDAADWLGALEDAGVSWSTTDFQTNPAANALRWGTLYNFRFDSNIAPAPGGVTIGLFKPGTPTSVLVEGLPVPTTVCAVDWNADGFIDSQDFFDFLVDFLGAGADFNDDGFSNSQDFFDFLAAFFTGCA